MKKARGLVAWERKMEQEGNKEGVEEEERDIEKKSGEEKERRGG